MALIIAAKADPFAEKAKQKAIRGRVYNSLGYPKDFSHVRRPFRGIVPKPDTYATLEVVDANGEAIPLLNAGARETHTQVGSMLNEQRLGNPENLNSSKTFLTNVNAKEYQSVNAQSGREAAEAQQLLADLELPTDTSSSTALTRRKLDSLRKSGKGASVRYSNFLITNVQETRQEKYQVMETFGAPYIFFFGERPRMYTFTGILLNSLDFQWRAEFWENYDTILRGTRLVELGARASISWDDIITQGYILQANAAEDSAQPSLINFSFLFFVTDYQTTVNVGDTTFPSPKAVSIDTAYWKDTSGKVGGADVPYVSNVDLMRRKNLEAAAQEKSPGLLGAFAIGLAAAASFATMATNGIENFIKAFETKIAGRDVRYPVGAFPLVDEIQKRPDLQALLKGTHPYATPEEITQAIAEGISPETRRLIQTGADDPAGLPNIFVQDKDLIIDLTKQYNQRAVRRIKILPPGGVFSAPTNPNYFGRKISDNLDEYVQQVIVPVTEYEDPNWKERDPLVDSLDEDQRLTDVIAHMISKFRSFDVPMTQNEMLSSTTGRLAASGVLRLGMAVGSFGTAYETKPSAPDTSMVDDAADIAEAQKAKKIWANKQDPSTSPKADMGAAAVAQPQEVKLLTPQGIKKKPQLKSPVISGSASSNTQMDQATLDKMLKQARRQNARSK